MDTDTDTTRTASGSNVPRKEIVEGLNDLLQLDHDAIGSYDVAIEKLENREHAEQIRGFRYDHERHIQNLNELIAGMGGTAANEPHGTAPLKEALQRLGGLGGDKGILTAWRANELQVRTKYDSFASKAVHWPAEVKRVIDDNALDEERHYQWVTELLGKDAGGESGMAASARSAFEGAGEKARDFGSQARDRAAAAASSARVQMADGLAGAAGRLEGFGHDQEAAGGARAKAGDAAHRVASGLDSTAGYLRQHDSGAMRSDFEERVRQEPLQTLLILFAAGFVAGRLLR